MLLTAAALEVLHGRLIVVAQAFPGEPRRAPHTMALVAASAAIGGAAAVSVQGMADLQLSRSAVQVPVIGPFKDGHDGVAIAPNIAHAVANIVTLDGTRRQRSNQKITWPKPSAP